MAALTDVPLLPLPPERFRGLLGPRYEEVERGIATARELFARRTVWHVNSTAKGGGVVELLRSLLAYARGASVDSRWVVDEGGPDFFRVTKRIHNHLHGWAGDGGALTEAERSYEAALAPAATELAGRVRDHDIVFLHDPQTAGLLPRLAGRDVTAVWRCHVGLDLPNDLARHAWEFLRGYVEPADAYVFSRREFVWKGLDPQKVWIVPPSIDAFSPKNQDLDPETVASILAALGLGPDHACRAATFLREDGTPARVDRPAQLVQEAELPIGAPAVTQVSRWDRLKDPEGVLRCFAEQCRDPEHLVLAGPAADAVADDPEGAAVFAAVREQALRLPAEVRRRVHLASLPMADIDENAAMVNAIQRRADVVVQKSLAEGFGLTVAEAMWKSRPVVASRRGGMQDQIVDGESGLLVDDPADLAEAGAAIRSLLDDPARARELGAAARRRVEERFLGTRHLIQYLELLQGLLEGRPGRHLGTPESDQSAPGGA